MFGLSVWSLPASLVSDSCSFLGGGPLWLLVLLLDSRGGGSGEQARSAQDARELVVDWLCSAGMSGL